MLLNSNLIFSNSTYSSRKRIFKTCKKKRHFIHSLSTSMGTGSAVFKCMGVRNMRNQEKPIKEGGYEEVKICASLHTWFLTNLPNCSSTLLTSSSDLRMEVLFELQTGLGCVPLKTGENSDWDKLCDVYFATSQISKEKYFKELVKHRSTKD